MQMLLCTYALIVLWLSPINAQKETEKIYQYQAQHGLKSPPEKQPSKAYKDGDRIGLNIFLGVVEVDFDLEQHPVGPMSKEALQYTYGCNSRAHPEIACSVALHSNGDVRSLIASWGMDIWVFEGVGEGMSMRYRVEDLQASAIKDVVVKPEHRYNGNSERREATHRNNKQFSSANTRQNLDASEELIDTESFGYSTLTGKRRQRRSTYITAQLRMTYDTTFLIELAKKLNLNVAQATIAQADAYAMSLVNHVNTVYAPQVGIKFELYADSRMPEVGGVNGNYGTITRSETLLNAFETDVFGNEDDLHIMFTGLILDGDTQGIAHITGACSNEENTGLMTVTNDGELYSLVALLAHELGHMFGCEHTDGLNDLMYPYENGSRFISATCRASMAKHIEHINTNFNDWYLFECLELQDDLNPCHVTAGETGPCGFGLCIPTDDGESHTCNCEGSDYTGPDCRIPINSCPEDPADGCENGGVCVDALNSFSCICPAGFTGDYCEDRSETTPEVNRCDPNPCGNGMGRCTLTGDSYTCTCNDGFELAPNKLSCVDKNECSDNPCAIGATCTNTLGSFSCECPSDSLLNEDLSKCLDLCDPTIDPCVNGACSSSAGTPTCRCDTGWSGALCDTADGPCTSQPCANGGSCTAATSARGYKCECAEGYAGPQCSVRIGTCADGDACMNGGACSTNSDRSYSCRCAAGYQGTRCSEEINECLTANTCVAENTKRCQDKLRGVNCICKPGYFGENCESFKNNCGQGIPDEDHFGKVLCRCPLGWDGENCQIPPVLDQSQSNACEIGGDQCNGRGNCRNVDIGNGVMIPQCTCFGGWDNYDCSTVTYDACEDSPCSFGGTCQSNRNGSFKCKCVQGRAGDTCELDVDECANNPCFVGRCSNKHNKFECTCPTGWTGKTCNLRA